MKELFNKNKKLSEDEFINSTKGACTIDYVDNEILSNNRRFNVYSE
jgi:hypothetical protein